MNNDKKETQCHFCKQPFANKELYGHMTNCSHVLEPCPQKCGSYIRRLDLQMHVKRCQNNFQRRTYNSDDYEYANSLYATIRRSSSRNDPLTQKKIEECVANIREVSDKQTKTTSVFQTVFKKLQSDIEILSKQNKTVVDWRNNVQNQLDNMKSDLSLRYENLKHTSDMHIHNIKEIIIGIESLRVSLNSQQVVTKSEMIQLRENCDKLKAQLDSAHDTCSEEGKVMVALCTEQTHKIDAITVENEAFERRLADFEQRVKDITVEVESVGKLCVDERHKLDKQQKDIDNLKKSVAQINLDVEMIEDLVNGVRGVTGTPLNTAIGRIIWKINEFSAKLDNAKRHDHSVIKSPIFFTHTYGYRIRLVLYLNGLKKWKGRYVLACLQILKGDYDELLTWPCRIEANVVVRARGTEVKDYSRYISAKREYAGDEAEEPQESSTQYIFIPHSTLLKGEYTGNDTVFLEIIVKQE